MKNLHVKLATTFACGIACTIWLAISVHTSNPILFSVSSIALTTTIGAWLLFKSQRAFQVERTITIGDTTSTTTEVWNNFNMKSIAKSLKWDLTNVAHQINVTSFEQTTATIQRMGTVAIVGDECVVHAIEPSTGVVIVLSTNKSNVHWDEITINS